MAMPNTRRKKTPMSDRHKAALAEGRSQGRAVRAYLEALEANKPKRGRRRSADSMKKRLEVVNDEYNRADPLRRLQLAQERIDLQRALESSADVVDMTSLEAGFTAAAKSYGERKGLTYLAWREVGVPISTLTAAGITRAG